MKPAHNAADASDAARGRKRLRGNVDRDLLLTVAAEQFAAKGYRATSLDDLAAALGIKKASLYHYITSKDEILVELYDRVYELTEERIRDIAASELPADERLRRMVLTYIELITGHTDMFAMALRNEHELSAEHRLAILKRHRKMERVFEAVIRDGQAEGSITNLNPRLTGLAMFGMVLFIQYWFRNTTFSADEVASEFITLLEMGWKPRKGRSRKVWKRADSLEAALKPSVELIAGIERDLASLRASLQQAQDSLEDGLVRTRPGNGGAG